MTDLVKVESRLRETLALRYEHVWQRGILREEVEAWLENFDGRFLGQDRDRILALYLLTKYVLITPREQEYLCRLTFRRYIHWQVSRLHPQNPLQIETARASVLSNTRFYCLGNVSESGAHVLYPFRQANALPRDLFLDPLTEAQEFGSLCLVDDVTLTGTQARDYAQAILQTAQVKCREVVALFLVATESALRTLESAGIVAHCGLEISDEEVSLRPRAAIVSDVAADLSGSFTETDVRLFCETYGLLAWPAYPLGYGGAALTIGLPHNVPDNTLPVLWASENWQPIVRRHPKIEGGVPPDPRPFL